MAFLPFLTAIACGAAPPVALPDEAEAYALYRDEPGFANAWPVELHIRIVEPLTQRFARAMKELGAPLGGDHFSKGAQLEWGAPSDPVEALPLNAKRRRWVAETSPSANPQDGLRAYLSAFAYVEHATFKVKQGKLTAREVRNADDREVQEDGRRGRRAHRRPGRPRSRKTATSRAESRFEATLSFEAAGREATGSFEATLSFEAAGREATGNFRRDHGTVSVTFARTAEGWRIARLAVVEMTTDTAPARAFMERTDAWLAGVEEEVVRRLRRRSASDFVYSSVRQRNAPRITRASPVAMDAHPGVTVTDVDGDGWDDLYVWDVLGRATLLRNEGGERFSDATDVYGLGHEKVSAALFADLDGDGALDLVLGRWFEPSKLYWREGSAFVDSGIELPSEVATVSVADVDRDGALDIFFGTAAHDHHARLAARGQLGRRADANVDQVGPQNLLLRNLGARRFEDATQKVGLALQRNTLQAAFADYDGDGWVDLFLGNDFAPASLYVNERGRFRDVSARSGASEIYFGMGASWGDVDGDGDLDLYASAMASSAGNRIMSDPKAFAAGLSAADQRARRLAARGNTLLVNDGGAFLDATATAPWSEARNANWSYGAQLFDADGDGWLDVYAPNGFFTAPGLAPEETFRDL